MWAATPRADPPSLEQGLGLGIERLACCRLAANSDEACEVQGFPGLLDSIAPGLERAAGPALLARAETAPERSCLSCP